MLYFEPIKTFEYLSNYEYLPENGILYYTVLIYPLFDDSPSGAG